ncbi:glutaconate CoA-transferase [Fusobacterium necrophorum]|uniref:glutaconate CoA-transferase subunit A n=1 Tax=Fusobacterium necrophorum TaxID=859 RepID=UPI00254DC401|nr:glutaconate CoA-transferase subunit A [Fusobacterium necrophorum]MDK4502351.1 glutaconate CoA-transferase [Fusobacterium necrophorum]
MSKVMSLHDAIKTYVKSGDSICIGGFTTNRKPYAAVYEILRQGLGDFTGYSGPAGGDWDMLIGEGRVRNFINCYIANSGYTNVCRRFRHEVEKVGKMNLEDYSQDVIMYMLHASSLGLPFLPVKLMQGSDLVNKWGISKEVREKDPKLPNDKLVEIENPLIPGEKVVAVPVPRLDVALIHVQKASINGTCSIEGDEFHDIDIAIAAKHCIVTCEELVTEEEIRKDPSKNSIPQFCVDAVVHAPFGAHPSQCYNYYDYDADFYKMYDKVTKTEEDFKAFLQEWVYNIKDNDEYIDKVGASRLAKLRVVPGFGYAAKLVKEAK